MSGPPANLSSEQLWTFLTQMPRPHMVVDLPRKDPITGESVGRVAMQVLTQEEQMICNAAAEKFAREKLKGSMPGQDEAQRGYEDLYKNAASVELVWRSCRKVEKLSEPFFPSPQLMSKTLSPDELGVLVLHYFTVQQERGPIVTQMTEEEYEAWIKRAAEGGSRLPFDTLSWDTLKNLAFFMACRLHNLWMATSSAGSPPDETASEAPADADPTEPAPAPEP